MGGQYSPPKFIHLSRHRYAHREAHALALLDHCSMRAPASASAQTHVAASKS